MLSHGKALAGSTLVNMAITKLERNQIYDALTKSVIDPAEYKFKISVYNVVIWHSSGSIFSIVDTRDGKYKGLYDVKDGGEMFGIKNLAAANDISEILIHIPTWVERIKEIVTIPDLLTEMLRNRELIVDIQRIDSGNTPFTQYEQRQIEAQLQEIPKQLEQFGLTSEQKEQVKETLDEAAEASERMGRKDWRIYFLGTITELIVAATVPAGVGEHIFTAVINGLIHLFGGGPPQILG
jgi:hypothetical protein